MRTKTREQLAAECNGLLRFAEDSAERFQVRFGKGESC